MAVSVLQIEGLGRLAERDRFGQALRVVAQEIGRGTRRVDVAGHLRADAWIVAMPDCEAAAARRRMDEISSGVLARVEADPELRGLVFRVGVADTVVTLEGVTQRASDDLQAARRSAVE